MTPGNADLIRPIYEEWSRGNWRLRFEIYDACMEWGWSDEFPGLAGVYEDPADPNPRLQAWLSEWEHWRAEADEYLEFGNQVVVLASYHGRGRGSGVEIRQEGAHVFELRDGKVVRLEIFASREKAMESIRSAGASTLEIRRLLPAPPSVVFRAFSEPDELAKWWGPEGFTVPSLDFHPRVGTRYRIEMQPPEGDAFHLTGEFREVDPPVRLAYTFAWEDPDPDDVETLVELSFRDLGESTEVVLTQAPFKTEPRRELHRNGWTDSFDKLEQRSAT